jgi:hypothetical protein
MQRERALCLNEGQFTEGQKFSPRSHGPQPQDYVGQRQQPRTIPQQQQLRLAIAVCSQAEGKIRTGGRQEPDMRFVARHRRRVEARMYIESG